MNQCMRIVIAAEERDDSLYSFVSKYAKQFLLEGIVQPLDNKKTKLIICGSKDNIENFIDVLYGSNSENIFDNFDIEPFMNQNNYRGTFRVIE